MDEERRRISELLLCALGGRTLPYQPPQKTMVSKIAYFLELKLVNLLEWLENISEVLRTYKIGEQESTVNGIVYLPACLWELYFMFFMFVLGLCSMFYLLVFTVLDVLICCICLLTYKQKNATTMQT